MHRMRLKSSEYEFRILEYFMRNPYQGTGFLSACLFLHIELIKFPLCSSPLVSMILLLLKTLFTNILSIPCRDTERSVQEEPQ
ncbi:MAG TPA: hypothetical protein DHU26_07675 [Spirochaetaceae bacterium]|nr:hypothetical protein [Spirochaetaceae bacterium]